MTRKKSAIIFTLIFTLVSFAQQRSEWKGEYLQELNASQSEIEFHLKNDQIIDSVLVQKFGNHKWSQVKMVYNKKVAEKSVYKQPVFWFQGENRYRLKYYVMDTIYYSETETYQCDREPIGYEIVKKDKKTSVIELSAFAEFSIWNHMGALIVKTSGQSYDISAMDQGVYYLLIDGRTEKFLKK